MKEKTGFFKPCNLHGFEGYFIPVRNSLNHKIENEFVSGIAKECYEREFGDKILSDEQFHDWYYQNAKKFEDLS